MAGKRKRSSVNVLTVRPEKKSKPMFPLTDLPIEIVDDILKYIISDPRDFATAYDPSSTVTMYTAPILQTSRFLRQQGLSIINRRVVWIRLKFHDDDCKDVFFKQRRRFPFGPPRLPFVPPRYQYLIPSDSSTVSLEFNDRGRASRRSTRATKTGEFIFPFNMVLLLSICHTATKAAEEHDLFKITIRYENMSDHAWKELEYVIAPALSRLSYFDDCEFVPELVELSLRRIPGWLCCHRWDLTAVYEKVGELLILADKLEAKGLHDEAGMLLLHNGWLVGEAEYLLPTASEWQLGEIDSWSMKDIGQWYLRPGRCTRGNELRGLLFEMEIRACQACCRLMINYGMDWCLEQESYWSRSSDRVNGRPETRFLGDPAFTWFGITQAQQAQLHQSRACYYEAENKATLYINDPDTERWMLGCAADQMYFAHRLQPDDNEFRDQFLRYKGLMFKGAQEEVEENWRERLVTKKISPAGGNVQDNLWRGDSLMLERWGGEEVLQYLPLAQKISAKTPREAFDNYLSIEPRDLQI